MPCSPLHSFDVDLARMIFEDMLGYDLKIIVHKSAYESYTAMRSGQCDFHSTGTPSSPVAAT